MLVARWSENRELEATPASGEPGSPALWMQPEVVGLYGHTATLAVHRNGRPVGRWKLPLVRDSSGLHARRPVRLLPYAAPWVAADHPQRQRRVVMEMLRCAQSHLESIDLPMAPGFVEVTACLALGIEATWRHTRVIRRSERWRDRYAPRVRNHVAAGLRSVTVEVSDSPGDFDFVHGVVHAAEDRRAFAERLSELTRVLCITATARDGTRAGQALAVADRDTAYLSHSWFNRNGSARGVPSVLVDTAADTSFNTLGVDALDLEGSVLPGVDEFMSGFGGDVCPYPHLHWSRNEAAERVEQ